jgi:hypothetical protein
MGGGESERKYVLRWKQEVLGQSECLLSYFPLIKHIALEITCPTILPLFVAMVTLLPSCCLTAIGDTHTETQTRGRDL